MVLAGLVLLPLYSTVPQFPFFLSNFIYVVAAITFTRYLFFLHLSWLRDRLLVQAAIIVVVFPLVFYMVQEFNAFITFFDEEGPDILVKTLERDLRRTIDGYMHAEFRFFGVWAVLAAAITPFRFIYNIWVRYRAGVRI